MASSLPVSPSHELISVTSMETAAAFKEGLSTLAQLPLDAPLMSTRRSWSSSGATNRINRSSSTKLRVPPKDASQRVPFSWERSPGVPKEARKTALDAYAEPLPWPPKLPPSRWRPAEDIMNAHGLESCGDGNGGGIDVSSNGSNDDDDEEEDTFSDALDEGSFCEKFDIASRLSSFDRSAVRDLDRLVHRTPSFIMNRFLPAANALANSSAHSSASARPKRSETRAPPHPPCSCRQQKESRRPSTVAHDTITHAAKLRAPSVPSYADDQTELPSKSCGLMLFFPWSMKPTVCGFKSPVRSRTPRAASPLTSIRVARCSTGDGWRPHPGYDGDGNGDGGVCVDKPGGRPACRSPRWGLSFLDTSRLRIRGRDVERWISARARRDRAGEWGQTRRKGVDVRDIWSLPQLRSPSESWPGHALRSPNKRF